jgi:acetyl-CoA carboxylase biotin carboxylase subunit
MEMNTRIQVEHPITEQVIDYDLIREQILVAGVAISVKLFTRSMLSNVVLMLKTHNDFRPSPGKKNNTMPGGHGVRYSCVFRLYHSAKL